MTLARAVRRFVPTLVVVAAAAAGTGCPAGTPIAVSGSAVPGGSSDTRIGGSSGEGVVKDSMIFQLIEGSVAAPASLANGADTIVGLTIDEAEEEAAKYRVPMFTLAQAPAPTKAEKVVQNALVSVRGYDMRTIPELPSLYTNPDGGFYFTNVPSKIAFFLEANIETRERTLQLLGLTRTEDTGKITKVKIDVASTLVARELMRMWQISGYRVSFKDLDPRDFNPLLLRLRKHLENGLPAGVFFDPSKVTTPDGDWSAEKDLKDSALVALDKIAAKEDLISREIDRLYLAVNFTITRVRDASRVVIPRPPSLANPPAASTAPGGGSTAAATIAPSKAPAKFFTVTGTVTGTTTKVKLRFAPDLERDEDGQAATVETDATGKYSVKLAVGEDGGAFYEVFVTASDNSEVSRGTFRVHQDNQVAPDFAAAPAPN